MALIRRAVADMDRRGIPQWDAVYPARSDLEGDILDKTLYLVLTGEALAAVFVLNEQADGEYKNGRWSDPGGRFAVLHRLCVEPSFQHCGIGRRVCRMAEETACGLGYTSLRLDAFSRNPNALQMYEALGYTRTGTAQFRKGLFYLMEKQLIPPQSSRNGANTN